MRATCERLAAEGQQGAYGFYEAIDYTPSRLPPGASSVDRPPVHGPPPGHEPCCRWPTCCSTSRCSAASTPTRCSAPTDLLLQERVPKAVAPVFPHAARSRRHAHAPRPTRQAAMRVFTDPETRRRPRSICSPTAATTWWSPARAAATAAGATWPSRAGARTPRAIAGAPSATCAISRAARSGRPPASRRSSRPSATRRSSRRPAPSSAARDDRHRHAHRDQRLARGRHRAAADHAHQPLRSRAHDRADQLRRGRAGPAGARTLAHPAFSNLFVQTELVRDRAGDPLHAPAALGRGAAAVDDAPDDGAAARPSARRRTRPTA